MTDKSKNKGRTRKKQKMKLHKFLDLLIIITGLVSVIFLARGILVLSPEKMLKEFPHYSALGWPSVRMILSKATQKADLVVGSVSVLLTFILQIIDGLFGNKTWLTKRKGVMLSILYSVVLVTLLINAEKKICKYNQSKMKKLAFQHYCESKISDEKTDKSNAFQAISREYFNLEKRNSETAVEFIKKVAEYAEWEITDQDFSKMPGEWLQDGS